MKNGIFGLICRWTSATCLLAISLSAFPSIASAEDDRQKELVFAALLDDETLVRTLVEDGADANAPPEGEDFPIAPLQAAVICGCSDIAEILVNNGALIDGFSLQLTLLLSEGEVGKFLFTHPAAPPPSDQSISIANLTNRLQPSLAEDFRDSLQSYAGGATTELNRDLLLAVLIGVIEAKAISGSTDDPVFKLLDVMLAEGYPIDGDDGTISLREAAARSGDVLLAREAARLGSQLPSGWTEETERQALLVGAAQRNSLGGISDLLAANANPNLPDDNGFFALAEAAKNGYTDVVRLLVEADADPDMSGDEQLSPLNAAATQNAQEMGQVLLGAGANPDLVDPLGAFPLRSATLFGADDFVDLLLASGADPNAMDLNGRTALHALHIFDVDYGYYQGSELPSFARSQILIARRLLAGGLRPSVVSKSGLAVLESNIDARHKNADLLVELIDGGAEISAGTLERAISLRASNALRTILTRTAPDLLTQDVLSSAWDELAREPDLVVALLEFGVALPIEAGTKAYYVRTAAGLESPDVLGLLLAIGLGPQDDPEGAALRAAIGSGHGNNLQILVEAGWDPNQPYGRFPSALHDFIASDTTGDWNSCLTPAHENAISRLIDLGFDIDLVDDQGQTVTALADRKPSTRNALDRAINAAGGDGEPIHAALRNNDLAEVSRLARDPITRDSRDSLGRTALSLALARSDWSAALMLLRAGATITTEPVRQWQRSDLDFASVEEIRNAFAVRLLQNQLIDIPKDRGDPFLLGIRQAYSTTRLFDFPELVWTLDCGGPPHCKGTETAAGNTRIFHNLVISRHTRRDGVTAFRLFQSNIRSIVVNMEDWFPREIEFTLGATLTIPGCDFTVSEPYCLPGLYIHNPTKEVSYRLPTEDGFEQPPTATFEIAQTGGGGKLSPEQTILVDRSLGPITITMDPVTAKVFSLGLTLEQYPTEEVAPFEINPNSARRMALYARLARLRQAQWQQPNSTEQEVAQKSQLSTVSALSAEAYLARVPSLVRQLLVQQAPVVAGLDLQLRQIRAAIEAQATYTPEQIDNEILAIDQVLQDATLSATGRATLQRIRAELIALRDVAASSGSAVNTLRETLFTETTRQIELYQALILELSQYLPTNELGGIIDSPTRTAIRSRLLPEDVVVTDEAVGAKAAAIRAAFGLPEPD